MTRLTLLLLLLAPAAAAKSFNGGKGATVDCSKDPEVDINHGNGTYTFKGACKAINVNGGANKLAIESVVALNINGAKNTIDVGAVDTITVIGAGNAITYKKGVKGDKTDVNARGAIQITRAK